MRSKSQPSLPTNRAFLVQFRAPSTGTSPSYAGRVEHVVSGKVTRFQSLEELLAFMVRVLTHVQQESGLQYARRRRRIDVQLCCEEGQYAMALAGHGQANTADHRVSRWRSESRF